MKYIQNPVLPGFNPDPSILRVGDDYYIATSTFEWFPGVQIHHSRDLVNWRLITRPLTRLSQLNMTGNPNSGGIWAPCLSYSNGIFYLVYTDVKYFREIFKECYNYLVTTTDITGEWSDPIFLNGSGFDPSLFHDDDGRKWLVNMVWDHRKNKNQFSGILLQEYSEKEKKLVGNIKNIFKGSELALVEGPHLYKRGGYYYLMTAEGGTGLKHAVTVARSRNIDGPYELDPENPMLTSALDPTLELQRAGHASLVETQNGEWYIAHLCSRPIPSVGRSTMGRETSIQKVMWTEDGWLRLECGGNKPQAKVVAPDLPECKCTSVPERDDFDGEELDINFQTLRLPITDDLLSLKERPGYLRLKGWGSLSSFNKQALVARRQQAFRYEASTCMEYDPVTFQNMAGLICYYNTKNFYYLHMTHDDESGNYLDVMTCQAGVFDYPLDDRIIVNETKKIWLKACVDYDRLVFYYSLDGTNWSAIKTVFDASTLSDEFEMAGAHGHFTGAFVGLCCQDLSGQKRHADFDYFEYMEVT